MKNKRERISRYYEVLLDILSAPERYFIGKVERRSIFIICPN